MTAPRAAPRIAIVGARRVRQGLGPFVASALAARGAVIAGFVGRSDASLAAGERALAERGVRATGYRTVRELAACERPDALAILSPPQTHAAYLDEALVEGLHALCEKPLLWGAPGLGARAAELVTAFDAAGLLLRENCQWPFALPAFHELFPEVRAEPLERFGMRLSPASRGETMIGDALPHALSVLQALVPDPAPRLEDLAFSTHRPDAGELSLTFRYGAAGGTVEAAVELIRGDALPREAGLTINDRAARRRVRMDDYALFLGSGDREVPMEDPLHLLLAAFLQDLDAARAGGRPTPDPTIAPRTRMVESALSAFRKATS